MALVRQISEDVTAAMRAGDRQRVSALRLVLSELQKAEKAGDADPQGVLRRERKRRREAERAYRDAGRQDLARAEAYEADLIEAYLPEPLSDAELDALVRAAAGDGAGPQDFGRVVKQVLGAAAGRADGGRVAARVKAALGG